jgi:molybdopterin adenylyltransferase
MMIGFDHMLRAGLLTVSDRSSKGLRKDTAGPAIVEMLTDNGITVELTTVCSDDALEISGILKKWCDENSLDLVVTTGGTGVSPRDVTPDATLSVISRNIPGMSEAMRSAGMKKTPHAMISRAVAGIRGNTLIINLPGSPKGSLESLEAVLPAIPHAIAKLQGDPSDCA